MLTCILHIGMPKTGTSSIQDSMYFGLSDPRFQYISFGGSNSVMVLTPLFNALPENAWAFVYRGWTSQQIEAYKSQILPDLEHLIEQSKAKGAALIFSSLQSIVGVGSKRNLNTSGISWRIEGIRSTYSPTSGLGKNGWKVTFNK